jgi:hypothetical protein
MVAHVAADERRTMDLPHHQVPRSYDGPKHHDGHNHGPQADAPHSARRHDIHADGTDERHDEHEMLGHAREANEPGHESEASRTMERAWQE